MLYLILCHLSTSSSGRVLTVRRRSIYRTWVLTYCDSPVDDPCTDKALQRISSPSALTTVDIDNLKLPGTGNTKIPLARSGQSRTPRALSTMFLSTWRTRSYPSSASTTPLLTRPSCPRHSALRRHTLIQRTPPARYVRGDTVAFPVFDGGYLLALLERISGCV